jgi:CheY-like chemotaxis protein
LGTNNSQLQPRILCVDDEPVGLTVRKLLLERKGYAVETASNGASAIDMFKIRPFDLVLLDYYMPAMNGAEVARAMRAIRPKARIVMLSAYVTLPEEALEHVDASITKGIHPEALLDSIGQLISLEHGGD